MTTWRPNSSDSRETLQVRGAEAAEHPADGAEKVARARAGGDQAEDPERQVAPPAGHAAGLGLPQVQYCVDNTMTIWFGIQFRQHFTHKKRES